ncbi:MAG: hypothetical protein FJY43_02525, partial [Betaproteobacteria bacterium]|nr:hypothetical protein [Betaproteobacteria bacterium]
MRAASALRTVLVGLLAAALPAAGLAAPFVTGVGNERIVLQALPGFADTGFLASPRLQELAESTTSASNRVLLFAITDADLRRFMVGDRYELRRYMLVVTPKGTERDRMNEAQFSVLAENAVRDLAVPAPGIDAQKPPEAQPEGKAMLLAVPRRGPGLVSILQGTRLVFPGAGLFGRPRSALVLSATALLHLRGKVLQLTMHSGY